MLAAGGLWLASSTTALAVGGEFGTLMLGVSSNLLVFYGFYLGWVRQTQDEDEFRKHVDSEEELEREQLQREAGPR